MGIPSSEAETAAIDRSRTLTDSGERDLMRVLFEGMFNDQGVAL